VHHPEDLLRERALLAQAIARYVVRSKMRARCHHRLRPSLRLDEIAAALPKKCPAAAHLLFLTDKPCPTPAVPCSAATQGAGGMMITAEPQPLPWNASRTKRATQLGLPSIVAQGKRSEIVQRANVAPLPPRKTSFTPGAARAFIETLEKLVDWRNYAIALPLGF